MGRRPGHRMRIARHNSLWIGRQRLVYFTAIFIACAIFFGEAMVSSTFERTDSGDQSAEFEVKGLSVATDSQHSTQTAIDASTLAAEADEILTRDKLNADKNGQNASVVLMKQSNQTSRSSEFDVRPQLASSSGHSKAADSKTPLNGTKLANGLHSDGLVAKQNAALEAKIRSVDPVALKKYAEARALETAIEKLKSQAARDGDGAVKDPPVSFPESQSPVNNSSTESLSPNSTQTVFKGVLKRDSNKHLFKTDNVTHLSYMLYRLVKTHMISSMMDISCTGSKLWMPELLSHLEFEIPGFQYTCILSSEKEKADVVARFRGLGSVDVIVKPSYRTARLPKVDLAFTWYAIGFLDPRPAWQLLQSIHSAGVKYAIVPSYPGVFNNPPAGTKHGRVNVRRAPYRFNEPLRMVSNMSGNADAPKHLLLYDVNGGIREQL